MREIETIDVRAVKKLRKKNEAQANGKWKLKVMD